MLKFTHKIFLFSLVMAGLAGCKKDELKADKNNVAKHTDASAVAYKDTVVTNFFRRETGHIASDAGFSIDLGNGKVIWLMGDSHIDDYRKSDGTIPWLFQVRNAALLQPKGNWDWRQTQTLIGTGKSPKSYLKNTEDTKLFIWPNSGYRAGNYLYIYSAYLREIGGGGFGFENVGHDLISKVRLSDMKPVGHWHLPPFNGINFGHTFIKDPNSDYVYTFGNRMTFIHNDIFLARFKATSEKPVWTFWNGSRFTSDVTKAKRVAEAMSSGCHVAKVRDKYVLVSTEFSVGCDQGKRIYLATADSPIGPFTKNKVIYTIDDVVDGHYPFFYAPILHPEYINDKNEVLLTYAVNGYPGCIPSHVNYRSNPDHYRLRGVRIPYSVILNN
ncbi:hypothetical protein DJ568_06840 [Mucilaginibacter hurinus]|uniref:DUF4185 domain-containing protein n=1 Tax=Mucilaginibacter hurinus TaxID=2201324 RepID=A0A367GSB1_9SPHI|nr:DUF4185 domain-containing protein [Mucilaginibacter hurinus]RCH55603.1 hypothetical protein DJ568_06840 [Mucilaginibacter hurinus]